MKLTKHIEIGIVVLILVMIYFKPSWLGHFSQSILGKVVFLVLIVCASMHSKIAGLFLVLLLVCLSENVVEGLDAPAPAPAPATLQSLAKKQKAIVNWVVGQNKDIIKNATDIQTIQTKLDLSSVSAPAPAPAPVGTFTISPPPPAPAPTSLFEGFTSSSNEQLTTEGFLAARPSNSLMIH